MGGKQAIARETGSGRIEQQICQVKVLQNPKVMNTDANDPVLKLLPSGRHSWNPVCIM
ncbi:hypothetical protein PAJ34TS1_16420 [Paenibacillus azoreducens]